MSQATGDPNTRNTPAASPKAAVVEDDDIPFEPTPAKVTPPVAETKSSGDSKANDILSMIRARQSK